MTNAFPKKVKLPDSSSVELRLMSADDRDAALTFARGLPAEDLLFLRVDLTQEPVIDNWINNLESGHSVSLVSYDESGMVGYATVHKNKASWTRRVGEIRVNISPDYRGRGLGKVLTSNIFDVARREGLKKLMANMTTDQKGAQAAFRRLGFIPEALLTDYVEDANGTPRDLVIMSYDVEGHTDQVDDLVKI